MDCVIDTTRRCVTLRKGSMGLYKQQEAASARIKKRFSSYKLRRKLPRALLTGFSARLNVSSPLSLSLSSFSSSSYPTAKAETLRPRLGVGSFLEFSSF